MAIAHDVVVIGGGPAGYAAALFASASGLDVGLVEESKLGGTCLHVGCIPAKELLETASVLRTVQHASEFGVTVGDPAVDLVISQERKQKVVDGLFKGLAGLLASREVAVYAGTGRLGVDHTVTVDGGEPAVLQAPHIVLATGSSPRTIPGFDVDGTLVVTSDELLSISEVPERVAVIGGGAIGCEFASMLCDLGSSVTLLEAMPEILPGCDADAAGAVRRAFKKRRIDVHVGVQVHGHDSDGPATTVRFGDDGAVEVEADSVVLATGFNPFPNPEGLVARLAREHQLRTDSHGRPILDAALRWHERLFVSGRAGELGVGPASPNIIGAHLAARRLVPFISRGRSKPADPWTPLR